MDRNELRILTRTTLRLALAASLVGVAGTACRKKSDGPAATTAVGAAPSGSGDPSPAPAPAPADPVAIEPSTQPADVTGAYLVCGQTDEAAPDAPSQEGLEPGELELTFGCAVSGADRVKRPGTVAGLAVAASLDGRAGPMLLKTAPAEATSAWHVRFKLPLHLAQAVVALTGRVSSGGTTVELTPPASPAGAADGPSLVVVSDVRRPEGRTAGKQLLLVKGRGFAGVTSVRLGGEECLSPHAYGDHLITCVTAGTSAPAAGLPVTVTTPAGVAKLPRAFSYVDAGPPHVCDDPATRDPLDPAGTGLAEATPFRICTRAQLERAVANAVGHWLRLEDNIDLGATPFPAADGGAGIRLDGGGFALVGLQLTLPADGPASGLFRAVTESSFHDLAVVDFSASGGINTGVLLGHAGSNVALERLTFAKGTVAGVTAVGVVAGALGDTPSANGELLDIAVEDVDLAVGSRGGGIVGRFDGSPARPIARVSAEVTFSACTASCGGIFGDLEYRGPLAGHTVGPLRARVTFPKDANLVGGVAATMNLGRVDFRDLSIDARSAGAVRNAAGGIAGNGAFSDTLFERVSLRGDLTLRADGTGADAAIGGAIGLVGNGSLTLADVDAALAVHGGDAAGGLVGVAGAAAYPETSLTLRDVRVARPVDGAARSTGGLVGEAAGSVTADHALVFGRVASAAGRSDPLVGNGALTAASEVYWDAAATDRAASATTLSGVGPRTTAELFDPATFGDRWPHWAVEAGAYPVLAAP